VRSIVVETLQFYKLKQALKATALINLNNIGLGRS